MKTVAAIVLVCVVLAGCADPPVARVITETPKVSYRASAFPWQGKFISTCHGVESLLIPQSTKVIWQGKEFVLRDVAHSRKDDYCLLDVGDIASGFSLAQEEAEAGAFRVLLNREGETKVVHAAIAEWPKDPAPPRLLDEQATKPGMKRLLLLSRGIRFPIRTLEKIILGDSGSPVLQGGKVVGILVSRDADDPFLAHVLPISVVRQELDGLKTELDDRTCPGEKEVSVSRK